MVTADVATARAIAREIRASSGGLTGVKAIGVLAHGEAQISMNITDFRQTPLSQVYAAVEQKAARFGARIRHAARVRAARLTTDLWGA